jgi:phosphatidylserine decarboxylase
MKTIAEWKQYVEKMSGYSRERMDTREFFRQPSRPLLNDPERMFSPADGVLLYSTHVSSPFKPVLDAKGINVSVEGLTRLYGLSGGFTVAGVFMTQWDVHSNCMPYSGVLNYKPLETLATMNFPMLETEKGLLDGIIDRSATEYMAKNQRMLSTVYNASLDYTFYIVQIADRDVDMITPFNVEQNARYTQCQKFSFIRFGSQCDLILPDSPRLKFRTLINPLCHVEGGVDALFSVERV